MERRIKSFLKKRQEEDLLRSLTSSIPLKGGRIRVGGSEYINFSSNDYLGLSLHPEILLAAKKALNFSFGSSASRLMTGSNPLNQALEEKVARFKEKEASLVFNSGYQANLGIISALCSRGTYVFSDKLNHASIVDGVRLSGAKHFRFRHNDANHLEELLKRERGKAKDAFIVTETVFSMDGDIAPLEEIVKLKKEHNAILMVDEAHATGIFGKTGSGIAEEKNLSSEIDIIMGTFGKALGGFGAYVACSREIRDYLINACRSFIYSTALPPAVLASNLKALEIIKKEPERRRTLLKNAGLFRGALKEKGFKTKGSSQIVPVIVGENKKAVSFSEHLKRKGYWTMPVRPPTVPEGEARLRISLTYDHDTGQLEKFIESMADFS